MSARPRLFLLDGLALAYRSHFAFIRRPLTNPRGENTSAVFAFANTVLKLRGEEKPDLWALAWDSELPTRRQLCRIQGEPPGDAGRPGAAAAAQSTGRARARPARDRGSRDRGRRRNG